MAESIPSRRPVSFLDLPGEIKNIIYDLVFEEGSNLRLDHKARDRLRSKNPPVPLDLSTTPEKNALLGTCHSIRTEAMPVLAKHTTLEIRNAFSRADPLSILPAVFLSNISAITVDMDTFVHITRSLMPSLKNVTIFKQVEGLGGLHDMLHLLHCPACGGAHAFLREGICDVLDWSWLKNQVIHLSEEEGWTVVFRMQYECASPVESCLVSLPPNVIHAERH